MISIGLAVLMLLSMSVVAFADPRIAVTDKDGNTKYINDFLDTQGHWAHDVIQKWAEYELISGYQGNFSPNSPIKRGDLCLIIDRMLGLSTKSYNFFYDLPSDKYYTEAVLKCVAAGLVNGTSSTTVNPEGYATREQIATIMCRLLSLDSTGWRNVRKFSDDSSISTWAKDSVYTMRKYSYMNGSGDNKVNPNSNITRAEFVQVMNNIAGSYIPKRDQSGQGTAFKSDFASNLMISRNIELVNSTVARDLILTPASNSISLTNTVVRGRVFAMGRSNIQLSNTTINQLYLKEGKSTVSGITDNISEVYVAQYASESSLDKIPTKLVLESGVRVRIDGTMYENTTNNNKVYYGIDIKADIAAEQGFVVGGPRISNVKMTQGIDNVISVSDARVIANGSTISEIGVVWLNQDSDDDIIIPNYQKRDGIRKYSNTKIDEAISFDVGSISGIRTYRMYVKDSEGLFAYSQPFTFTAYSYSMNLKVYDNDYPQKIDVELILQGNNLPEISNIRVTYGTDETYAENRKEISLRMYEDSDSEYKVDANKYRRYIATISVESKYDSTTQENVYNPPTYYGYIITFRNGEKVNRYPVLSNVVPEGVSPMGELKTGYADYLTNGNIIIKNSAITTRYVVPQEVGILYKVSTAETVGTPTADTNGWKRVAAYVNIGLSESTYYDNTIVPGTTDGYTYYAAYVKTSNGYWYGDVKRVPNNSSGDIDGYKITEASIVFIDNNTSVLNIKTNDTVDLTSELLIDETTSYIINGLSWQQYKNTLYIKLENISYQQNGSFMIRLQKATGQKSNLVIVHMSDASKLDLSLINNGISGDYYRFLLSNNQPNIRVEVSKVSTINSDVPPYFEKGYLLIPSTANINGLQVKIDYYYYMWYPYLSFSFSSILTLS